VEPSRSNAAGPRVNPVRDRGASQYSIKIVVNGNVILVYVAVDAATLADVFCQVNAD
jgi:hypothetical protein